MHQQPTHPKDIRILFFFHLAESWSENPLNWKNGLEIWRAKGREKESESGYKNTRTKTSTCNRTHKSALFVLLFQWAFFILNRPDLMPWTLRIVQLWLVKRKRRWTWTHKKNIYANVSWTTKAFANLVDISR